MINGVNIHYISKKPKKTKFLSLVIDEKTKVLEPPAFKFIGYLLSLYGNSFIVSLHLTQICSFLKENQEKKKPVGLFYSKLFLLSNKTKNAVINKDSIYFFLLFRNSLKKLEESQESKETFFKYDQLLEILRKILKDYEIYEDFFSKFNEQASIYIKQKDPFLEMIVNKFNFSNQIEAIAHLETLLKRNDPDGKKAISYLNFNLILLTTYGVDIEDETIKTLFGGFVKKNCDVCYVELIKEFNKKIEIEYYSIQYLVLETLYFVNNKKKQVFHQSLFQEIYDKKGLFDFNHFKNMFDMEKYLNYLPLIFGSVYYENNFFKIHDYLKKKLHNDNENGLKLNCYNIDFSDFYNKNKMSERFCEVFDYLDFVSNITCEYVCPAKIPPVTRAKSSSFGLKSNRSDSSEKSKKSKEKRLSKRGSFMVKNFTSPETSGSPRKGNVFLGLKVILAKQPFKKKNLRISKINELL